jgi:hypothetical protein
VINHVYISAEVNSVAENVFVYRFDGQTWLNESILEPVGGLGAFFGDNVDVSGDRIIVTDPGSDHLGIDVGTVYVYRYVDGSWSIEQNLYPHDALVNQRFGWFAAIDGNTVMVYRNGEVVGAVGDPGAVYVFENDGTQWSETQVLLPTGSTRPLGERFGFSIDIDGDKAVISIASENTVVPATEVYGGAFLYERDGGSGQWSRAFRFVGSDLVAGDFLAGFRDVRIDAERVAIGGQKGAFLAFTESKVYIFDVTAGDCNGNGEIDSCEIAGSATLDLNGDGILDCCQSSVCIEDANCDGTVNVTDLLDMLAVWGPCSVSPCRSDVNGDTTPATVVLTCGRYAA